MQLYPEPYEGAIFLADGYPFNNEGGYLNFDLQTEDPKQLPLPSLFLLKVHHKFVNALHHFRFEEYIAEGWPPRQSSCEIFSSFFFFFFPFTIYPAQVAAGANK